MALACAAAITALMPLEPAAAAGDDATGGAAPPPTTTVPATPTTLADNVFVPEDQDLDECISALPKPGCGSESRGGWRQTLVFAVMLVAMVAIAVRIAFSVRRRDSRGVRS